jgi:hypothetical protein
LVGIQNLTKVWMMLVGQAGDSIFLNSGADVFAIGSEVDHGLLNQRVWVIHASER